MNDNPGTSKEVIKLTFDKDCLGKADILYCLDNTETKLEVISEVKYHYNKWYQKVLNILTFKLLFNKCYSYKIKIHKNENN